MKRTLQWVAFILAIFTSKISVSQSCITVNVPDQSVCTGNSVTLAPIINYSGNASEAVDSTGNVDHIYWGLGAEDGQGTYFCKGSSGPFTRAVWKMPCVVPSGSEVCFRIKVNSSTKSADYKIYGGSNSITNPSTASYTLLSSQYHGGNTYQWICITTSADYRYFAITDEGATPFYVDAISYDLPSTCSPTYSWSTGATTETITVSPSSNTTYTLATTVCGNTVNSSATVTVEQCSPISCIRKVSNTYGCVSTPYIFYLKTSSGSHHLSGDSTLYTWTTYSNGDARLTAEDLTASGLSGTYDIDILFTGYTTTAPSGSPKSNGCVSWSSTGWGYWTSTSGTIESSAYGTIAVTRDGPAMQIGNGANISSSGFGASGWLDICGSNHPFTKGDINVMLSSCQVQPPTPLTCSAGKIQWESNINFNPNGSSTVTVRFIDGNITRYKLPNLPAAFSSAVKISVDEVVSWDGYPTRLNVTQPNEQWENSFL